MEDCERHLGHATQKSKSLYKQDKLNFILKERRKILLTDLTRWPMPMMSEPFFLISFTNSIGIRPASEALLNCRAAASKAPPNLSPWAEIYLYFAVNLFNIP